MKFAPMFTISSLLLIPAMVVIMQPRDMSGPMNIGYEDHVAILMISAGILILAATGLRRIGQILNWACSLTTLGVVLLGMNLVLAARHPQREGIITDSRGRVAPDELSILGAYGTAFGLFFVGIACFLSALHRSKMSNKPNRVLK